MGGIDLRYTLYLSFFQFKNNPFLAMSSSDWKDTPSSKMFKTLYKYIIGLNEDNKEIDMTRPVINKMIPQRRTRYHS